MRRRLLPALLIAAGLACAAAPAADAKTVWLCKPGLKDNPCKARMDTARYSPTGQQFGGDDSATTGRPPIDCFYVYPTVSEQPGLTATRRVDPELRSIARFQVSRFADACRIFAPVYRQVTLAGIVSAPESAWQSAYRDVRAAWRTYLEHRNHGRGVVLIGHSQGTFHLRDLIAEEIDPSRRLRRRLVSALLLGGNITVAQGRDTGGDFRHVRACRAASQVGCVVAYSAFNAPVPANALFGRTTEPGRAVLCTNPAALAGGAGTLDAMLPRKPFAPGTTIGDLIQAVGFPLPAGADATWLAFPGSYTARCAEEDGASVLQVAPVPGAPALTPAPAADWGLHLGDVNLALGNLEELVRRQAAAYARR